MTWVLVMAALAFVGRGADAADGRRVRYDCLDGNQRGLVLFEEKDSHVYGMRLNVDGKERTIRLVPSESASSKVESEVFEFRGFVKIVHKTTESDKAGKITKGESITVLVDADENDPSQVKSVASVEILEGKNLERKVFSGKYPCQRKFPKDR